MESGVVLIGLA